MVFYIIFSPSGVVMFLLCVGDKKLILRSIYHQRGANGVKYILSVFGGSSYFPDSGRRNDE